MSSGRRLGWHERAGSMLFGLRHFSQGITEETVGDVWRAVAASIPRRLLVERFALSFLFCLRRRRIGEQTARTRLPRAKDFLRDASWKRLSRITLSSPSTTPPTTRSSTQRHYIPPLVSALSLLPFWCGVNKERWLDAFAKTWEMVICPCNAIDYIDLEL